MKKKDIKYLILGSNSFSGSNLVNHLLNKKFKVIGLSRSKEYPKHFLPYKQNKNIKNFKFHKVNINSQSSKVNEIVNDFKPNYIINFAAQGDVRTSWEFPQHWYETNFLSLSKIANNLIGKKFLKKFLSISTPEVYGSTKKNFLESKYYDPSTPYALSKLSGDLHLLLLKKKYNFPVVFSRSANVYGPYQLLYRIIPRTLIYLKLKKKLTLHGEGKSKRSFIHIHDVVDAYEKILQKGLIGETYHISPSEGTISIVNLVKKICKITNYKFENFVNVTKENFGQDATYHLSSKKLINYTGWNDRFTLEEGILDTNLWIEKYWKEISKSSLIYNHKK